MSDFQSQQANLSQSQALAAAIQRAKQIAAKIQPNQQGQQPPATTAAASAAAAAVSTVTQQPIQQQGVPTPSAGGGFKRQHDDTDTGPESKRFTSPSGSDYGHNNNSNMSSGSGGAPSTGGGGANLSQAVAQAAAVAARLAATAVTTCEEQVRIPESIVNAFMGRNGSDTISHIQVESGCKLQLSQDQERVITLRGTRDTVTKGRDMLQQMANRNGGGTVEVVLTMNISPPGPSGYPPYQEIMIPGAKVGLVIGKGGDTIKQLQEKTGAKMVIIQDGPNQEVIKPLRISGEPQKIEHAKQLVLELIAQKDAQTQAQTARAGGGVGGPGGHPGLGYNNFNNGATGGEQCEVFVPKIAVGVVIGKGGETIRKIQTKCGCKLQFIEGKNDEPGDRRCLIQGTHQQVDEAKQMIEGLIDVVMKRNGGNMNGNGGGPGGDASNSNYGYGYGVNHTQQPAREEITFMVPASKCGIVIGRGGETIKLINQQSGAYTEMDRNAVNPPNEKLFKSKGSTEQVESARQLIAEKINMELTVISRKPISGNVPNHQQQHNQQGAYGQNPMQGDPNAAAAAAYQQPWGAYGQQGGWEQAQQQHMAMSQNAVGAAAGAAGQADYSAQWIEYYKSMGMHREAEMIEQQLKAKQQAAGAAAAAAAAAAQPQQQQAVQQQSQQQQAAGGQTADYSAQWADYYRSIGKIEEAEAIEKQIKIKQQNGAGTTPASVANPVSAGAPTPGVGGVGAGAQGAYPQGMTPSQYAQYSQYYAAAAAAGQQQQPQPAGAGGYPQQAYAGYGGYPGAPQPPGSLNPQQQAHQAQQQQQANQQKPHHKNDK